MLLMKKLMSVSLLCGLSDAARAGHDNCCEHVYLSPRSLSNNAKITGLMKHIEGIYRFDGYNRKRHGGGKKYRRVDAQNKPVKARRNYIAQHDGKYWFARNAKRPNKHDMFIDFNDCLEDSDIDGQPSRSIGLSAGGKLARDLISIDTSCHHFLDDATTTAITTTVTPKPCEKQMNTFCPLVGTECPETWMDEWLTPNNCPRPSCTDMEIVDSWRRTRGGGGKPTHGFALKIYVPTSFQGWSVLLRFPKSPAQRGTYQVWNANIWNLYEKNNEFTILLHQLWWPQADKTDENSIIVIADQLPSMEKPTLLFYEGRVRQHGCFSDNHRRGGKQMLERANEDYTRIVNKVKMRGGQVKRRGRKLQTYEADERL